MASALPDATVPQSVIAGKCCAYSRKFFAQIAGEKRVNPDTARSRPTPFAWHGTIAESLAPYGFRWF
jgi:hypothetical protein